MIFPAIFGPGMNFRGRSADGVSVNTLRNAARKKRDLWIWSGLAVATALAWGMRYWELAAAPAAAAILVAAQRLRASRRKAAIENRMARSLAALIIKVGDSESEPAIGGRPRVLVADDHLANGEVARHILTGLGARVDVTTNGREAIERMRVAMYDLVLMDCQMPGMTGPEAVEKIRRAEGSEWHTPIVAMTTGA